MKYTEELDKVSYCFGLSIASNLLSSGVNTINTEAFVNIKREEMYILKNNKYIPLYKGL